MFHYLGIVTDENLRSGNITPTYILCQAHGSSDARSGWRVVKQTPDNTFANMNKVLVKTLVGNEDMIEFLCNYRTRDHMHGDKRYSHEETKKYYPKGALFWFECNQYGEPGKYAILITKVPMKSKKKTDGGFQAMKENQGKKISLKTMLIREPTYETDVFSEAKPKLIQKEISDERSKNRTRRV